nr:MAG TPA: hypothetical protein [Crassvirales sp.]
MWIFDSSCSRLISSNIIYLGYNWSKFCLSFCSSLC